MKAILFFLAFIPFLVAGQQETNNLKVNGDITTTGYVSASKNTLAFRYYVGTKGNFTTIKAAIDWLSTNMTGESEIILDCGTHLVADSIHVDLPYNLVIRGTSSNTVLAGATTGLLNKPFFSLYSNVTFHSMTMDGSTLPNWGDNQPEDMVRVNNGCTYIEFDDVVCYHGRVGLRLLDSTDIWVTNSVFEEMSGEGIGIYNASTRQGNFYDIEINTFRNCTKGIEFSNGDSIFFDIKNNVFLSDAPTDTALYFTGVTIKTTNTITAISGNDLSSSDKALIGLDFTLVKNANIYVRGNKNIPDLNPMIDFDVDVNAVATAIITTDTWTKANWDAYDNIIPIKFSYTGVNSINYLSSYKTTIITEYVFSIQVSATNKNYEVAIVKNPTFNGNGEVTAGTINGMQAIRLVTSGADQTVVVKSVWHDVIKNDDFSLIIKGVGTTDDPTITYLTGIIE